MTMTNLVGTWVAATVLSAALAAAASAQEPPRPVTATVQTARPTEGFEQGVKVHGRWTIDVRNPDGSLAARHEFNNALDNTGREVLAGLLARGYFGVRQWEVRLSTPAPTCDLVAAGCSIVEFIGTGTPPPYSLSVHLPMRKGGNGGYVQLTGTARFALPGAISAVSTGLSLCHNTPCSEVTITHGFTSHTLTTPIPVAAGQLVEVTVFLNFS